jgi:hypothetical protein
MTLQTDLEAAVTLVTTDSTLLHAIVHGPASGTGSTVATDGGDVKTVAKAIADVEAEYTAFGVVAEVAADRMAAEAAQVGAETAQAAAEAAQTAAEAAASAGGVKVSANDTTSGPLNGKLVAGSGICFAESNDGGSETLTISASGGAITADTTLAVGSGQTYATLTAVMAYLSGYRIAPGCTVTIKIHGEVTEPATVTWSHPDGNRIQIQGSSAPQTTSISAYGSVGGSSGGYTFQFNVANGALLAVGDWIGIHSVTGSSGYGYGQILGFHRVTAVSGNLANVLCTAYGPWVASTLTSGTVTIFKDRLKGAAGSGVIQVLDGSVLKIDGLAIVNNTGTSNGTMVAVNSGYFVATNCGFGAYGPGGNYALYCQGSTSYAHLASRCWFSGSFWAWKGASIYCDYAVGGGGGVVLYAQDGGIIRAYYAQVAGSNSYGMMAMTGGVISAAYAESYYCGYGTGVNVTAQYGGLIYMDAGKSLCHANNHAFMSSYGGSCITASNSISSVSGSGYDYYAYSLSTIRANPMAGGTSCSPAVNTVGNFNSYIANG